MPVGTAQRANLLHPLMNKGEMMIHDGEMMEKAKIVMILLNT